MKLKLRHKITGLAVFCTVIPTCILIAFIFHQGNQGNLLIKSGIEQITDRHLKQSLRDIHALCQLSNELIQEKVNSNLRVARFLLNQDGKVHFSKETTQWNAINQYTRAIQKLHLPKMFVGQQWLGKNETFDAETPIVDRVEDLTGDTCTIFQRINEAGDMLRVATSVPNEGKRAIGTYIPAINPDGTPNPVIATVIGQGKAYRGRAYVVNDWYLSAYEPIFDDTQRVIGILYVGVRHKAANSLRAVLDKTQISENSYLWILRGKKLGSFVYLQDNPIHNREPLKPRSVSDETFLEGIRSRALSSNNNQFGKYDTEWKRQGRVHPLKIYYAYFPEWDWILGITAFTEDFKKPYAHMREILARGFKIAIGLTVLLTVIFAFIAAFLGHRLANPISFLTQAIRKVADGELAEANAHISQSQLGRQLEHASDETGELRRSTGTMIKKLRGFAHDMHGTIDQLSESTKAISSSSRVQASVVQDFSTSTQQIATAAQEIGGTSNQLSATMDEVSEKVHRAAALAGEGRQNLQQMNQGIQNLVEATGSISQKLNTISQSTQSINQIITTIVKVADQTNLLSLNAAIEAEKAGEKGLGFSVVAREIRRLADQTAEATIDIERIVKTMHSNVNSGVAEMGRFNEIVQEDAQSVQHLGKQMQAIIDQVESLTPRFEAAQQGMVTQAAGTSQISEAVSALNVAAQQTQSSLNNFRVVIDQLENAGKAIRKSVHKLKSEEEVSS